MALYLLAVTLGFFHIVLGICIIKPPPPFRNLGFKSFLTSPAALSMLVIK